MPHPVLCEQKIDMKQELELIQYRQELAAITDEHTEYSLRAQDAAQGKWLAEDPPLSTIQYYL